MALPPRDLKLLRRILTDGHALEKIWNTPPSPEAVLALGSFRETIRAASQAESQDLSRLAFHADRLPDDVSARHLAATLVPFERLNGRALRDDEFLVTERDAREGALALLASTHSTPFTRSLKVVADNLRSSFNVGAILRTAECFGCEEVLLTGYTSTPADDKTAGTSMGADAFVKWSHHDKALAAIDELKAQGFAIVALETVEGATPLADFQWPEKSALVLGNERFGVDHEVLARADHLLRIPLVGRKNSLNVGIAFGIAAADWRAKANALKPLSPVGRFHANARYPYEARRQGSLSESKDVGTIELERSHNLEAALEDLEGFERIWVLYRFHHNENWKPKILPPRGPRVKRGVFATRSPYRPNPLGLSCVRLEKVEGRKLLVSGFDLLDGTPIYDIKPYVPYADSFPNSRTGWLEGLDALKFDVNFSPSADADLAWLEANGVANIREFLVSQLEFEPLDEDRKRVTLANDGARDANHEIAYRTWRADFSLDESEKSITVHGVRSGYSVTDLASTDDRHADKDVHRRFLQR